MCIWGIASWIPPIQLTYLASWIWKWYEVVNNPYIAIYITEVHPSNGLFSMWLISHFYQSGLLNILNMHDWQHDYTWDIPTYIHVFLATSGSWDMVTWHHDIPQHAFSRFEKLATPRNSSPAPWWFIWWPAWFFQMWKTDGNPWFPYWKMIYKGSGIMVHKGNHLKMVQHFRLVNYSNLPSRMVDFPHLSVCLQEGTQETQGNLVEWWWDGRYG
jgi:hypothetical protein